MKYIKKFDNVGDYQEFKDSTKYKRPNVSFILESEETKVDPIDYSREYFTIEALEDGLTAKLSINDCEYRVDDGGEWNSLSKATNTVTINTGQILSFRGNLTPSADNGIGTFTISKKCNVKGNIMSLLYGDNFEGQTDLTGKKYAFHKLFNKCTNIVDASELILPATTLSEDCYYYMFWNCTSLTTAPELPATILAYECYNSMFYDCSSLTIAPQLPATELVHRCYQNMFYKCTSLTTSPELPTTILANYCYESMFSNCTSLTIAPELPATTLTLGCYCGMFSGCTNLTTAPELPATTLTHSCYDCMFERCTSLTTSPELPATTLALHCYYYMFYGCTSLNNITMLATNINASNCLYNWVSGVAATGTFTKAASMTSLPNGVNGIPSGWTVINNS